MEIAKGFANREDLKASFPSAVDIAYRIGIADQAFKHMLRLKKKNGTWTKETVKREALKYSTRTSFRKNALGAYDMAHRIGIMDDICKHMYTRCSSKRRSAYAIEFEDGSVYIGITVNYKNRLAQHIRHDRLSEKIKSVKYKFVPSNNWNSPKRAQSEERLLLDLYIKRGWKILNKNRIWSLGNPPRINGSAPRKRSQS